MAVTARGGSQTQTHRNRTSAPTIEPAQVMRVWPTRYTVDVYCDDSSAYIPDIDFGSLYTHDYGGEGIFAMPEAGAQCWVCHPSNETRPPFVLCFRNGEDTAGYYKGARPDLNPGDLFMGGRSGNQIIVRRGGVIEVRATHLAQRLYLPLNNTIRDLFENYEMLGIPGDVKWTVNRVEKDPRGMDGCVYFHGFRETALDTNYMAKLEVGRLNNGAQLLSLQMWNSGLPAQVKVLDLSIDKLGNLTFVHSMPGAQAALQFQTLFVTAIKGLSLTVGPYSLIMDPTYTALMDAALTRTVFAAYGSIIEIGDGMIVIDRDARTVQVNGVLLSGVGGQPVALGVALQALLATHTHDVTIDPSTPLVGIATPSETLQDANTWLSKNTLST